MARVPFSRLIAIVFVLTLATAANAAFVLTTRFGQLSTNYSYGQNPDIRSGSDGWSSGSLTSEFNGHIFGTSSGDGTGPNGPWSAGISYDSSQTFASSAAGFDGSGQTTLNSFLTGNGFSSVATGLPGNNLLIIFENTTTVDYSLSGAVSSQSNVTLQRFNGSQWEDVFSTGGPGAFNFAGTMTAGSYSIQSIGTAMAAGNSSATSSWNYSFTAVPEPAAVSILALGLIPWLKRTRRGRSQ